MIKVIKKYFFTLLFFSGITFNVYSENESKTPEEKLQFHAVQSNVIKNIMHRINSSYFEAAPDEFQRNEALQENITHLIININELLIATLYLNQSIPAFELTEEEKNIFQVVAEHLNKEALSLREAAVRGDHHGMNVSYQRLTDTCSACHELFRF